MTDEQPIFTCPSCGKNVFDVGVTECATNADISTVVDFKQAHLNVHETQINSQEHQWVKCNNCHNGIEIDADQLDAVFSGRCTEEQMKIQCKIIQRPVFECPSCKINIFKVGIYKVTHGGTTKTGIDFCSDGINASDVIISDITDQWSKCGLCGARIDIDAIDLIKYYEGECTYNDIARDDLDSE